MKENIEYFSNRFLLNRDPRLKILFALTFIGFVIFTPFLKANRLIYLSIIFLLIVLGDKQYSSVLLKRLALVYPMIFFISLFSLFKSGDEVLFAFQSITIFKSGLHHFLILNSKLIMIFGILTIISLSTKFSDILLAIKFFKMPSLVISILYFTNRFIFILTDEARRKILAFKSRYIEINFLERIEIIIKLISSSTIKIFEKNEVVYSAMISRGFNGIIPEYKSLKWSSSDTSFLLLYIILFSLTGVFL